MIVAAVVLVIGALVFTLFVRAKDLPELELVSPVKHLEERKATIYENLRDLQFEYRLGKLSDQDYQQTKQDLQKELAAVLAEIDAVKGTPAPSPAPGSDRKAALPATGTLCPRCGAKFANAMKFCGECGTPMPVEVSK
jgi:cytochrome c-type biogenesis protein CcmI